MRIVEQITEAALVASSLHWKTNEETRLQSFIRNHIVI